MILFSKLGVIFSWKNQKLRLFFKIFLLLRKKKGALSLKTIDNHSLMYNSYYWRFN